jgi:aspartyl-tRNA synthetase
METMKRTVTCGALRAGDAGKVVTLNGWVHRHRDHGGVRFYDIRDRYGLTQVVVDADAAEDLRATGEQLKFEYCIAVEGLVRGAALCCGRSAGVGGAFCPAQGAVY